MKKVLLAAAAALIAGPALAQSGSLVLNGSVPGISVVTMPSSYDIPSVSTGIYDIAGFTTQDNSGGTYTVTVDQGEGTSDGDFALIGPGGAEYDFALDIDPVFQPADDCSVPGAFGFLDISQADNWFTSASSFTVDGVDPCAFDLDLDLLDFADDPVAGSYSATVTVTIS